MYAAMSAQGAVQGRNDLNLVFAGTGPPPASFSQFSKSLRCSSLCSCKTPLALKLRIKSPFPAKIKFRQHSLISYLTPRFCSLSALVFPFCFTSWSLFDFSHPAPDKLWPIIYTCTICKSEYFSHTSLSLCFPSTCAAFVGLPYE